MEHDNKRNKSHPPCSRSFGKFGEGCFFGLAVTALVTLLLVGGMDFPCTALLTFLDDLLLVLLLMVDEFSLLEWWLIGSDIFDDDVAVLMERTLDVSVGQSCCNFCL